MFGRIDGRFIVPPARIDDGEFGRSRAVPTVQRFVVGGQRGGPGNVGRIVKETFFPDVPPFALNVCFSCGETGFLSPGVYGDPHSIWFNVFFGYYQISAPRPQWDRPFAYRLDGDEATVEVADIIRIGKADWNYFSNYLYGVPREHIAPYDAIPEAGACARRQGRTRIGRRFWDLVELDDVAVVSAYLSRQDGKRLVNNSALLTPLWRLAFGRPRPRPDYPESFIPARMRARLYLSYSEAHTTRRRGEFRTLMFGGAVSDTAASRGQQERFLALQLAATRTLIETRYRHLGFEAPGRERGPRTPSV
jgi:hypothetical protein